MSRKDRVVRPLLLGVVKDSIAQAKKERLSVFDTSLLIALNIAAHFDNERFYVPSGSMDELIEATARRNAEIFDSFKGNNTFELAKMHGMTQRNMQQIIANERNRRRRERDAGRLK